VEEGDLCPELFHHHERLGVWGGGLCRWLWFRASGVFGGWLGLLGEFGKGGGALVGAALERADW
jgi:hypothetical protein